ncbi:hypothetical protein KY362_00590 [Candidatus Woesearchaeota archaeon]|nr:hypothetical protein [Candidatus Woesearchaeota archaeon]
MKRRAIFPILVLLISMFAQGVSAALGVDISYGATRDAPDYVSVDVTAGVILPYVTVVLKDNGHWSP